MSDSSNQDPKGQNHTGEEEHYHTYDGIVEHNNPMPAWWRWTFVFTVIFAFMYYVHYEVTDGPTLQDELKIALAEIDARRSDPTNQVVYTEEQIQELVKDSNAMAAGKAVFAGKCAVCHGDNLEGKIGPNLTDKFWIHGDGTALAISKVIKEGSAAKGMPPWDGLLSSDEIAEAAAYIISHRGTNPANPKAPEGVETP